ncbi:MAG: zinc-ribbon domain-containing protein [Deltaproteobacteria bacterium]|nr:zinc-ribbon domain-containing protein [Deltaproteobacteria bacterium]
MIIKCPQCETGYNIPDQVLTEKPRKMKCAKCQHLFTVVKRSSITPKGYTEFTGAQELPPEFAFLRANQPVESSPEPKKIVSIDSAEDTSVGRAPAPPQSVKSDPANDSISQSAPVQGKSEISTDGNISISSNDNDLVIGGANPVGRSMPATAMFGDTTSAWEIEAPLELGSYSMTPEIHHSRAGQITGKIFFIAGLMITGLLIFTAYRNSWTFSIFDIREEIAFAFSDEPTENLPPAVENIDVSILDKKIVMSQQGDAFLVIAGEVVNNNPAVREHIIIRGKLYDADGKLRSSQRMPCGKVIDEKALKKTDKGEAAALFRDNGVIYNCSISSDDSTLFQIIFEDVPDDYNAMFNVKVQAVAATDGR